MVKREASSPQSTTTAGSPSLLSTAATVPPTLSEPTLLLLARIKDELAARADGKPGVVQFEAPDGVMLDDDFLDQVPAECCPGTLHIKVATAGKMLIVEYMRGIVHQRAASISSSEIWSALTGPDLDDYITINGSARQDLNRNGGQEAKKEPDGSFQPRGRHESLAGNELTPTVVIEVGASETDQALRIDVQRWFSSPVTKMIVNVVITVSVRVVDGQLAIRLVTFVRERPQRPTVLRSQASHPVTLVEPERLQHTWTRATPWPHDFVLPTAYFFDWDDSALGRQGRRCPEVHAASDVVVSAKTMNKWCGHVLEGHTVTSRQS